MAIKTKYYGTESDAFAAWCADKGIEESVIGYAVWTALRNELLDMHTNLAEMNDMLEAYKADNKTLRGTNERLGELIQNHAIAENKYITELNELRKQNTDKTNAAMVAAALAQNAVLGEIVTQLTRANNLRADQDGK